MRVAPQMAHSKKCPMKFASEHVGDTTCDASDCMWWQWINDVEGFCGAVHREIKEPYKSGGRK